LPSIEKSIAHQSGDSNAKKSRLSQRPTHCTRQLDMGDFGFATENVLASGAKI